MKVELQELFDSVGSVDGYIEADAEQILRGFQTFSSNVALATAVAAPPNPVSQLWSPHYFADDRIGGATELRLINLESRRVFVFAELFDENGESLGLKFFLLEPGEVFSEDMASFFGFQPPADDRLTGHFRLNLFPEGYAGFVSPRVRVIGVINFSTRDFYSSLPLLPFPSTITRFFQVAQSNSQQLFTGLAILSVFGKNPDTPDLHTDVRVRAVDSSGLINAEKTLELRHGERFLGILSEDLYFGPGFEQIGGHLEIETDFPVFIFALFGDFRTTFLSAIEGQ